MFRPLEHVIGDAQHCRGDRDDRLLVAEARFEAEISRAQAGILDLDGRRAAWTSTGLTRVYGDTCIFPLFNSPIWPEVRSRPPRSAAIGQ